jgi:hypothetical protein
MPYPSPPTAPHCITIFMFPWRSVSQWPCSQHHRPQFPSRHNRILWSSWQSCLLCDGSRQLRHPGQSVQLTALILNACVGGGWGLGGGMSVGGDSAAGRTVQDWAQEQQLQQITKAPRLLHVPAVAGRCRGLHIVGWFCQQCCSRHPHHWRRCPGHLHQLQVGLGLPFARELWL